MQGDLASKVAQRSSACAGGFAAGCLARVAWIGTMAPSSRAPSVAITEPRLCEEEALPMFLQWCRHCGAREEC